MCHYPYPCPYPYPEQLWHLTHVPLLCKRAVGKIISVTTSVPNQTQLSVHLQSIIEQIILHVLKISTIWFFPVRTRIPYLEHSQQYPALKYLEPQYF
jgi:hypothetical protein